VLACRRWRDVGGASQLGGGACGAIEQSDEHRGARRIGEHAGDLGDAVTGLIHAAECTRRPPPHASVYAEAWGRVQDQAFPMSQNPGVPIELPILYFGTPVVLVVTMQPDGRANITPISSVWGLDQSIVLGLGTLEQGYANLLRERECVVNFPQAAQWQAVESIARTTGSIEVPAWKRACGYEYEKDKFRRAGLTRVASETVAPPRIAECPFQVECRLVGHHLSAAPVVDEEGGSFAMVEVVVTKVHAHPHVLDASQRRVKIKAWNPLLYVFRSYYGVGPELGRTFRAATPTPAP
jgi:flavin reductase (DIM6/NTAB) family NADH-FMN oxidoreductase RutF